MPHGPMDRRDFCRSALGGAAALGLGLAGAPLAALADESRRTNILMIVAEDMGPHLGCYGDRTVPTPNLDRLAGQGVLFRNAWVTQPSCSPSRSSILTGLYPHQNFQLGLAHCGYTMHRGIPNIPSMLKQAGYRMGIGGKLHVNPARDFPFDARLCGHTKDVRQYADKAEAFFRECGDQPFFLSVNYADAHRPFADQHKGLPAKPVGPDDVKPFPEHGEINTPETRAEVAGYYNAVQRVDAGVGLLLDVLERSGKAENTLVVFIGDHGPPFTRGKTTTYEFGLRIPYIVRWPGRAKVGLRSDALVSTVDLLPTCLAAAGRQAPGYLPGRSLSTLVTGNTKGWRRTLCGEWNTHGVGFKPQRAIRDERYKLILNLRTDQHKGGIGVDGCKVRQALKDPKYADSEIKRVCDMLAHAPEIELYDLAADPVEYHNLAGRPEHAAVQKRLLAELQAWRKATDDPTLDAAWFERMKQHHAEYAKKAPALLRKKRQAIKDKRKRKRIRIPVDMTEFQRDWTQK